MSRGQRAGQIKSIIKSAGAAGGSGADGRRCSRPGSCRRRLWLAVVGILEASALLKLEHVERYNAAVSHDWLWVGNILQQQAAGGGWGRALGCGQLAGGAQPVHIGCTNSCAAEGFTERGQACAGRSRAGGGM